MCVPLAVPLDRCPLLLATLLYSDIRRKAFSTSSASKRAFERGSERHYTTLYSINLLVDDINIMSSIDDGTLSTTDNNSDNIYFPTTPDKEPITYTDNDATIEGTLYEIGRYYKRNGLFQMLFDHHAVSLGNGKLAVDSNNAVYYTSGKITDAHSFDDPCPPTPARFAKTLATRTAASRALPPDLDSHPHLARLVSTSRTSPCM